MKKTCQRGRRALISVAAEAASGSERSGRLSDFAGMGFELWVVGTECSAIDFPSLQPKRPYLHWLHPLLKALPFSGGNCIYIMEFIF